MNLIVDIGNTKIKFALFEGQTLLFQGKGNNKDLKRFVNSHSYKQAIVSSVVDPEKESSVISLLDENKTTRFTHEIKLPISNLYLTPKTLGKDRLANVVGAFSLFPDKNLLVIDSGTCIKFDSVSDKGEYSGGAISPGLFMRFKSLKEFTGKLPLVNPQNEVELIGKNTEESILSGVVNGCIQEIEGVIGQYKAIYENLTVILTGGDASFFDKELKNNIFVKSNLTLIGLNEILLYNTRP